MLTVEEIRSEVSKVSYKSDWWFEVRVDPYEGPYIFITAHLPNAYEPSEWLDIGVKSFLPPMRDRKAVHEWLEWRIERIESHEVREFYTVDGERLFDPHAEEAGHAWTER